jgi:phage gp36-like protein
LDSVIGWWISDIPSLLTCFCCSVAELQTCARRRQNPPHLPLSMI